MVGWRKLVFVASLLGAAWSSPVLGQDVAAAAPRSGEEVYRAACASCHGEDGGGMPRVVVGFDVPIPDLRDCAFSTVEPLTDWFAVTHEGGPARGFDPTMPAFGQALSEEEIGSVLQHLRSFCHEPGWPWGELNLPRALITEKAFPENEVVFTTAVALQGRGNVLNELLYEQRLGARGQLEVSVPFGYLNLEQGGWTGGLGDLRFALKQAVLHSMRTGTILSLALELALPTGREDRTLGAGVAIFEPFLAIGQLLPGGAFAQGQTGVGLPFRIQHANAEAFWRAVLGFSVAPSRFGRMWSPMVELTGVHELVSGGIVEWSLVPQMQVTLSRRRHVRLCAGVDVPLDHTADRKLQAIGYLLWDWFDGGLLQGW